MSAAEPRKRLKVTLLIDFGKDAIDPAEFQDWITTWVEECDYLPTVDQCLARWTTMGQERKVSK